MTPMMFATQIWVAVAAFGSFTIALFNDKMEAPLDTLFLFLSVALFSYLILNVSVHLIEALAMAWSDEIKSWREGK